MKFTNYFHYTHSRLDRQMIKEEWISSVVANPEYEEVQHDGRIRRWAKIRGAENKVFACYIIGRWGNGTQRFF